MTTGFLDYDAEGENRRIFLDLVGFVGDTPALSAVLDVLGHTANACCHLCTMVRRSSTLVGSRYTRSGFSGSISSTSRGFYQHTAVRDCYAGKETCRRLGMKPSADDQVLPIHALRNAMSEARHRIPKTDTGKQLIPGLLDPYRSLLVAPDHLLTGHFRDCLNFAFKVLPSVEHKKACEFFMIGLLYDCRLPSQNRLYDHDKRKLFSMSMTELYALSVVAELGLIMGYANADVSTHTTCRMPEICHSAISLVRSCARLIADLWFLPDAAQDGVEAVQNYFADHGRRTITRLQLQVSDHLHFVEALCRIPDSDVIDLDDPQCGKRRREELLKAQNLRLLAIQTIDKPNLHRLRELSVSTIPMLGHVSLAGELVLEKTHQCLKRGIKQSNNKEPHLQSINNVIVNDWQGRLTLLADKAIDQDPSAIFGCFRLLAGREAVADMCGVIGPRDSVQVIAALGPKPCVPAQLAAQDMSVISKRAIDELPIHWELGGGAEVGHERNQFSQSAWRCVFDAYRNAFPERPRSCDVRIGDSILSNCGNGKGRRLLQKGDVVQSLCIRATDLSFHFPLVQLAAAFSHASTTYEGTGTRFWCISSLISIERSPGVNEFFAAVLPCLEQSRNPALAIADSAPRKYTVVSRMRSGQDIPFSFLLISSSMRPVATIHHCTPAICRILPRRGLLDHSEGFCPLKGESFYIKARRQGYPPRRG